MLTVTFTRTAARMLIGDLAKLNVPGCDAVRVGTLHGLCFSMLASEDVLTRLGRGARPIVAFTTYGCLRFEGAPMAADLANSGLFGGARACTKRVRAFEAAWARLDSESPGWPTDPTDRGFQNGLLAWLRFHRAMLIGELVPEALRYLRSNPASPERDAFDHVLVDEYQDLNKAEQVLLDLLADHGRTAIVGDPDQSIYSFRHAHPQGIEGYAATHPGTHDERLDACRRCPPNIVSIADSLIRYNHAPQDGARLVPSPGRRVGEVTIVQWTDLDQEAAGVADAVRWYKEERGYDEHDILVLSSRRLLGYRIRNKIRESGLAVHSFYHEEPLESELAQRALCLLTLLSDGDDRVALRWWLGAGHRTFRSTQYARLREVCEGYSRSPREVLEDILAGGIMVRGIGPCAESYRELKYELLRLAGLSVVELVDELLPDHDEDCASLREIALAGMEATSNPSALLDRLRTQITQPDMPETGDYVRVMSLHKSKGLTSKVVIVAGCIEGLIPIRIDQDPEEDPNSVLREQRRLFYVAITRATDALLVSSAQSMERRDTHKLGAIVRPGRTHMARTVASRFLDELGPSAPAAVEGTAWARSRTGARVRAGGMTDV